MHPPNRRRPQHPVNRRRPRPTQLVARRRTQWLSQHLRRASLWLRALARRIRQRLTPADTAVFGRILRPWDASLRDRQPGESSPVDPGNNDTRVADPTAVPGRVHAADPTIALGRALAADPAADLGRPPAADLARAPTLPAIGRTAAELGRRILPHAANLGRQIGPRAADLGRRLGPLTRQGARATGRGVRAAGRRIAELRPLLGLLRRFFAAIGNATIAVTAALGRGLSALGPALVRHQALLLGLLTRVLWWGALVLFLLGGQALVEIHGRAPLDAQALPAFAAGLGLCALLVLVAAQARIRWAALVLGFGHGGLLALVWVVAAAV